VIAYLGFCDYHLNAHSDALKSFNKSLLLNPSNNIALFGKSMILYQMNDLFSSYILLDSVCKINPTHDKAFYFKASIELEMGDTVSAIKNLNKAISNAPLYTEPYYLLSSVYLKRDQQEEADSLLILASIKKTELLKSP